MHLKGTPQRKGAAQGPSIPEGLRVPRDDASAAAVKKQMLEALKPTQGMMQAVMGNAQLMQARARGCSGGNCGSGSGSGSGAVASAVQTH